VFRRKQGIDVRTRHEVTELDLEQRRVRVRDLEGAKEWWEAFDLLHIATGAAPFVPAVAGADAAGIYTVSTLQSGIRVRRAMDERKPRRAVVVGGGHVGLEMAEAFLMRELDVALVEMMPQVMNTLDPDMGALVSDEVRREGIELYLDERLEAFEVGDDGHVRALVTNRRTLPADIVVLGLGVRPNSDLVAQAGVPLGIRGAIRVNERMETGIEGVWAAGDCVESFHMVSRQPTYVALGTVANKQGRVAGINIGGGYATFPGVLGTSITKFCSLGVAQTGLRTSEIEALGLEYATAQIEGSTAAHYYPDAAKITVKVLAEKGSGRLLGGQIVAGGASRVDSGSDAYLAAKRIDILATALQAGMRVDEMLNLDLAYAPPFSPVWDPVLIAVRQVIKSL
jgi:NADPH-dependent 2,4-dienoyl-CoA reductase/sulfur reductase-like enzyme